MPNYVIEGPRWYRTRIRSQGPFLALVAAGRARRGRARRCSTSATARRAGWSGWSLGVFAAPGLLAVGAPFSERDAVPARHRAERRAVADRRLRRRPPGHPQPDGHVGATSGATTGGSPPASGSAPPPPSSIARYTPRRSADLTPSTSHARPGHGSPRAWPGRCRAPPPGRRRRRTGRCCSRWSTIAAAVAGPMPGSSSSSSTVAWLTSIGPDGSTSAPDVAIVDGDAARSRRPPGRRSVRPSTSGAARLSAPGCGLWAAARRRRRWRRGRGSAGQLVHAGLGHGAGDVDDDASDDAATSVDAVASSTPAVVAGRRRRRRRTAARPRSAAAGCAAATTRRHRRRPRRPPRSRCGRRRTTRSTAAARAISDGPAGLGHGLGRDGGSTRRRRIGTGRILVDVERTRHPPRIGHARRARTDAGDVGAIRRYRSEQLGGEPAAVLGGARVVGTHQLEDVDELLAGLVVVLHPVEQPGERGVVVVGRGDRRAGPRPPPCGCVRSRGSARAARAPRSPSPPVDEQLGERDDRVLVARLELERLAQAVLVAGGDQLGDLGLLLGRQQAVDELARPRARGRRR